MAARFLVQQIRRPQKNLVVQRAEVQVIRQTGVKKRVAVRLGFQFRLVLLIGRANDVETSRPQAASPVQAGANAQRRDARDVPPVRELAAHVIREQPKVELAKQRISAGATSVGIERIFSRAEFAQQKRYLQNMAVKARGERNRHERLPA